MLSSDICQVSNVITSLQIVRRRSLFTTSSTLTILPTDSGIRPKLQPSSTTPEDFSIQHIAPGFINLMGIESPGLTSSMAIASYVETMVRRQVLGLGVGSGRNISNVGVLEDWA